MMFFLIFIRLDLFYDTGTTFFSQSFYHFGKILDCLPEALSSASVLRKNISCVYVGNRAGYCNFVTIVILSSLENLLWTCR